MIRYAHSVKTTDLSILQIIPGLVPVSTGVLKLWKPSVVRDHVKTRKLKLNAEDNLAYAA